MLSNFEIPKMVWSSSFENIQQSRASKVSLCLTFIWLLRQIFQATSPKVRTKKISAAERTFRNGQGSRESSTDRTLDISVYSKKSNQSEDRLTLDDLEDEKYAQDDLTISKRPSSAAETAFQNLSVSLNGGHRTKVKPRKENRPGSSRSRIPIPIRRANYDGRSPSPFFRNPVWKYRNLIIEENFLLILVRDV